MATFIRADNRVINLEFVTDAKMDGEQVTIWLMTPLGGDGRQEITFDGETAKLITTWIGNLLLKDTGESSRGNSAVGAFDR